MTIASSTTRPDRERDAQQRDVVDRVAERPEQRHRADERDRQRQRRDEGRDEPAQEQEDHQHDQGDGAEHGQRHVVQRRADRDRAVVHELEAAPIAAAAPGSAGIAALTESTTLTVLASGWRWTASEIERLAVEARRGLDGLEAVLDLRRRRAGAPALPLRLADDQVGELGGVAQLPVRLQRQRLRGPSSVPTGVLALAARSALVSSSRLMLRAASASGCTRTRTAKRFWPKIVDLRDAVERRQRRRDQVLGVVVQVRQAQRRRRQRHEQHRRVGRVDLAVRRRDRHLLRQLALRAQQRRLHVDRGGVDVAALVELERDRGAAERVGRADDVQRRESSGTASRAAARPRSPSSPGSRRAAARRR